MSSVPTGRATATSAGRGRDMSPRMRKATGHSCAIMLGVLASSYRTNDGSSRLRAARASIRHWPMRDGLNRYGPRYWTHWGVPLTPQKWNVSENWMRYSRWSRCCPRCHCQRLMWQYTCCVTCWMSDPYGKRRGFRKLPTQTGQSKTALKRELARMRREAAPEPVQPVMEEVAELQIINNRTVAKNITNVRTELNRHEYEGVFAFDTFRNRPVVMKPIPHCDRPFDPEAYPRPLEDADYLTVWSALQWKHIGWHAIEKRGGH